MILRKEWDFGLDALFGYAYTDAEDVSPMTSSVAASNFNNLALSDINNPIAATSNYVVPHRFTIRARYAHNFFTNLETRFPAYAYASEGQPQSYVMDSSGQEDGIFFGRHLLYIPTGVSDPNVVFDDDFPVDDFFAWVARNGLGPGFTERNGQHARWTNRIDIRIDQELPSFGGTTAKLFFKMYNFGNFLSSDWGKVYDAQFFSVQIVRSDVNDDGQFVFESFSDRSLTDLREIRSLWSARVGIEINF